jgi:hypothetical protein
VTIVQETPTGKHNIESPARPNMAHVHYPSQPVPSEYRKRRREVDADGAA